jgi:hypothetical protein
MTNRLRLWPQIHFGAIVIAILLLALPALAQQDQALAQQPASSQEQSQQGEPGKNDKNKSQAEQTSPSNDRLFFVLPNNLTVENEDKVGPLSSGGKFKLVAKNAFDPAIFPFIGFIAVVGQAQNSQPEFGQGAAGFGKRYGVAFANATVGSFMTGAVFPSLFKQDPRYYQLVRGGFKRRAAYSLSRIFITRTDSGHSQFNSSEMVGNLVAAGIANAYVPAQDRSFSNTMTTWGSGTGWDALANLAQEFWPDIRVWLKQKFHGQKQN